MLIYKPKSLSDLSIALWTLLLIESTCFHVYPSGNFQAFALDSDKNSHFSQEIPVEIPLNKHYFRASSETLLLLGVVSANYWATRKFSEDFDYDISFETLEKKFTGEAVRFEDNDIINNSFPGHPLSGSIYYLIARNHNLSRIESFLWSFTSSFLFETFVEFSELLSINDMITTPFAGSTIGESMYHLSRYLKCPRNKNNFIHTFMGMVIDPVNVVHGFIWKDTNEPSIHAEPCNQGLFQNRFDIFSGISVIHQEAINHFEARALLGFYGKIYLLPHPAQETEVRRFLKNTAMIELALELVPTNTNIDAFTFEDIVESFSFYAKTLWAAYHQQRIRSDSPENRRGYSFLIGPASAFEHIQYHTEEFEDWIGTVNLLGPALEVTLFNNNHFIRINLDVFADFSMVRAFSFDEYRRNHPLTGIKSVLRRENYYYAFGVTIHPKIEMNTGVYRFIAEYKYSHHDSIEGADRRAPLTNDFDLKDQREEYRLTFGRLVDFLGKSFEKRYQMWIEAEVQRRIRKGFITDDDVFHKGRNTWLAMRIRLTPRTAPSP